MKYKSKRFFLSECKKNIDAKPLIKIWDKILVGNVPLFAECIKANDENEPLAALK